MMEGERERERETHAYISVKIKTARDSIKYYRNTSMRISALNLHSAAIICAHSCNWLPLTEYVMLAFFSSFFIPFSFAASRSLLVCSIHFSVAAAAVFIVGLCFSTFRRVFGHFFCPSSHDFCVRQTCWTYCQATGDNFYTFSIFWL